MRPRQRPAADLPVVGQAAWRHGLGVEAELPVSQLPDVEVPGHTVRGRIDPEPAEEDVAGCLHQALAFDDSLTLVVELARSGELAQYRRTGLLDLQEQRIGRVLAQHEQDPAARADAANADHLPRYVGGLELVLIDQVPPVAWQGPAIGLD